MYTLIKISIYQPMTIHHDTFLTYRVDNIAWPVFLATDDSSI